MRVMERETEKRGKEREGGKERKWGRVGDREGGGYKERGREG
jgi:hypothetical protein